MPSLEFYVTHGTPKDTRKVYGKRRHLVEINSCINTQAAGRSYPVVRQTRREGNGGTKGRVCSVRGEERKLGRGGRRGRREKGRNTKMTQMLPRRVPAACLARHVASGKSGRARNQSAKEVKCIKVHMARLDSLPKIHFQITVYRESFRD